MKNSRTLARSMILLLCMTAGALGAAADFEPVVEYSTYVRPEVAEHRGSVEAMDVTPGGTIVFCGLFGPTMPTSVDAVRPHGHADGAELPYVGWLNVDGSAIERGTYFGEDYSRDLSSPGVGLSDCAVDAEGNVHVTGWAAVDGIPLVNAVQEEHGNAADEEPLGAVHSDAYVAKIDPTGTTLLFSTYFGGGEGELPLALDVDDGGAVTIVGEVFAESSGDASDAFAAKILAGTSETELVFSAQVGGRERDAARDVVTRADGSTVIVGATWSPDFPSTRPAFGPVAGADGFAVVLDAEGALAWAVRLGGSRDDWSHGVDVDVHGAVYVAGPTHSDDFPLVAPALPTFLGRQGSGFVSKLASDGSALEYSTYVGGHGNDLLHAIGVDSEGRAVVAGGTTSAEMELVRPIQSSLGGCRDGLVAVLSSDGGELELASYVGGTLPGLGPLGDCIEEHVTGLRLWDGVVHLGGLTDSSDFPTEAAYQDDANHPDGAWHVAKSSGFVTSIRYAEPTRWEPSALDLREAPPFTVSPSGSGTLDMGWEESMGDLTYRIQLGTIESLWEARAYDHVPVQPCPLSSVGVTIPMPEDDSYFLVVAVRGELGESSYGRDSLGRERPSSESDDCP